MPSWGLTTPIVDYFFRNYELSVLTRKSCCDIFRISGNGDLLLVGATSQWTVNRQLSPGSSPLERIPGIIFQILWASNDLAPQSTTLCAALLMRVHRWMSPFDAQGVVFQTESSLFDQRLWVKIQNPSGSILAVFRRVYSLHTLFCVRSPWTSFWRLQ